MATIQKIPGFSIWGVQCAKDKYVMRFTAAERKTLQRAAAILADAERHALAAITTGEYGPSASLTDYGEDDLDRCLVDGQWGIGKLLERDGFDITAAIEHKLKITREQSQCG